ncbi:DNA mismatch repair protein MutL [Actinobacillus succinogenes]|uniref:DNA mismatch repair protein MutL n=1 Tax=Actinobacillus succinogenes (strain ATCC 55618 / DSM 22257 / CCUG 43843 / 130Z) TaxID=339671 RepID=MUTL_ACTSZ|nr:DNA mismatch repair endonuclease MutL [Actinobacillus succinogenes]A6VN10.1 RecName: Full=DNA mismatch repair protein MutL [Actinobacillus succinogenes 130Z]ABR74357.1 DNA mismatch repair protein MutL [Actinobacillus succinogenes 130Z]PHI39222.1 DNA mismatch repair protein MutL [Actinobacillus succinogenes]
MPIQILPPQLANQIAAGEVVERPASVVKELVENSLDAGATRIQIDIENGGATLIRIRDNGFGIPKEELSLALARHATSKIATIDDLEAILSFGFRGEALASISSVSRLTLTSRTADQQEAWQVFVQGREQESTVNPASHPVGTTVEVANLFFNMPARRKFLRTDKTEFGHIDEVIRRIALAKSHIAFTLTHNGKIVRQYKSAVEDTQKLKRLAAICGNDFVRQALYIDWKHDNLHLSGWVTTPTFARQQNDLSYCYVNGRMVKDKVINHAIRQAYAEHLGSERYPAFVLFLDLNPNDVDVNVHPTKHEVRFQQSRLIHDFIFQGVTNALLSAEQFDFSASTESEKNNEIREPQADYQNVTPTIRPNRAAAGQNMFELNSPTQTKQTNVPITTKAYPTPAHSGQAGYSTTPSNPPPHFMPQSARSVSPFEREKVTKTEQRIYAELLKTPEVEAPPTSIQSSLLSSSSLLHAVALVNNQALLLQRDTAFYLLPLNKLQKMRLELLLTLPNTPQQMLLIPVVFRLSDKQQAQWRQQKIWFEQSGFEFIENPVQHRITLNAVPQCLRHQNLQKIVIALLNRSLQKTEKFLTALLDLVELPDCQVLANAVNILQETELLLDQQTTMKLDNLLIPIDFSSYLS